MIQNVVHYSPALERADPAFDETLQTVIKRTTQYITESVQTEGVGQAVRDAHAKGYGLVRAEVDILSGLAPEYAQGIYARPGQHEALIRFSNGSPHAGADARLGNGVGMGLKLFGIDGPMLLEDEQDSHTFDYALINAPIFFCNTVEHYLFIQQLFLHAEAYFRKGKPGQQQFLHDWVTGMGTLAPEDWAWDELAAVLSFRQLQPVNLLLSTYWTMGAVRHGSYMAKVRAAPTQEAAALVTRRLLERTSAQEVFRPALVAELQEHSFSFDLQVQLCVDLEKMPIEDVTVEWPEQLSPFVTVARVHLPQQEIGGEENLEQMDAISITPGAVPRSIAHLATSSGHARRCTASRLFCATNSIIRCVRSRRISRRSLAGSVISPCFRSISRGAWGNDRTKGKRAMTKRILCIGERPEILAVARTILEDEGYEVRLRATPFHERREIEALHPDLIVLTITAVTDCLGRQTLRLLNLKSEAFSPSVLVWVRADEDILPGDEDMMSVRLSWLRRPLLDRMTFLNSIRQTLQSSDLLSEA